MTATLALTESTATGSVSVAVSTMPVPVTALSAPTAIVQRKGPNGPWSTVRGLIGAEIDGSGVVATVLDAEFIPGALMTYRAGTDQTLIDQFGRTVAAGSWGTPDSGAAWLLANAAASVSTGKGRIQHASAATAFDQLMAGSDYGDARFETTVTVSAGSLTGGGVQTDVLAHFIDGTHYYQVRLEWATAGTLTLTVNAAGGGGSTALYSAALAFTHSGSATEVRLIVETEGNTLRVMAYSLAGAPPDDWTYEGVVPVARRNSSGAWGVSSTRLTGNSNANLQTVWDDVWFDAGEPYFTDTDTITVELDRFWLKSISRSFLNLSPLVVDYSEPSRDGRGGSSEIIGRTLPIAQVELMSGRSITLDLKARSLAEARQLEYLLASGDVLYLTGPSDCPIPFGHYRAKGTDARRESPRSDNRVRVVPLEECAAPGPDVVTATVTWETVLATFATWEDVALVYPTWELLLTLVGDPAEVIVG